MHPTYELPKTSINVNQAVVDEGETIEDKVTRFLTTKQPIKDTAAIIHTMRSEGVKPEFDIRTDRFDLAVEAMDYVSASNTAKRENKLKAVKDDNEEQKTDGGAEPIHGKG